MAKQDEISQFFDGVGKLKSLNKEENEELFLLYKQNPSISIRNKIVEGNLRLVIELAKQYSNQGHDFMSLIQEGNLGLMEAVDKFDVEKGFAFSSYATIYIDGRIKDYLKRNNSKFHFVSLDQEDMFQNDNALSNKITDFEDPSTIYQEKAKGELILKALDTLTKREKEVILLRFPIQGEKVKLREIAKQLGISIQAVEKYYKNAKRKINEFINKSL